MPIEAEQHFRRAHPLAPHGAKNNTQVAAVAPNEYSTGPWTESAASYTMSISMLTMPKPGMNPMGPTAVDLDLCVTR